MKWHKPLISPYESYSGYIIIQTVDDKTVLVKWSSPYHNFYDTNSGLTYSLNDIVKWAYVEEDDDIIEEQTALTAISAALQHVKNLYNILLTDGILCNKKYADEVGLSDLYSLDKKVSNRIVELDNHFE